MELLDRLSGFLNGSVGNNLENNVDDVKKTKRSLRAVGYFEDDDVDNVENPYITRKTENSIKKFQRDNDLREDGKLYARGETERGLMQSIAGDVEKVFNSKESKNSIGFGGNVSGIINPPAPKRKPKSRQDEDGKLFDQLMDLADSGKGQKRFLGFVRKVYKKGPLFMYDLSKRTAENVENRKNGPI